MKIGIQLYNFRVELQQDFRGTLRRIAELGADGVEFACDYGKIPPEELAAYLKELGLGCAGTMFRPAELLDATNPVWEYAKALETPAVTVSLMEDFTQTWPDAVKRCRKIGENAARHGMVFSYHNHWAEFADIDGECALYRILDACDPEQVFLEPDVCWITRGGCRVEEVLRRYASRIRQIHLKDIRVPDDRETTTALGTGVVEIANACRMARETACQWLIYEQDCSRNVFADAVISLEYLRKINR